MGVACSSVDHIRHSTFAPKQLEKRGNGVFMG